MTCRENPLKGEQGNFASLTGVNGSISGDIRVGSHETLRNITRRATRRRVLVFGVWSGSGDGINSCDGMDARLRRSHVSTSGSGRRARKIQTWSAAEYASKRQSLLRHLIPRYHLHPLYHTPIGAALFGRGGASCGLALSPWTSVELLEKGRPTETAGLYLRENPQCRTCERLST
jgi:hypothetical protein